MFKRMLLWFAMNIAVIVVITISFTLIEMVFGIPISTHSGGYIPMFIGAAVIGFMGSFISLFLSKWMAKRAYGVKVYNASEMSSRGDKYSLVYSLVEDLAKRNRIKMPEVGVYESSDPNAFATGASKNNSLVAVSTGLVDMMDRDAIEGVIAHEMAHIFNGDMVTMTLLQGVLNTFVIFIANILTNIIMSFMDEDAGALVRLAIVIVFEILLGILASLIAMAFSRHREFRADAGSARLVGKQKMIAGLRALQKMQNLAQGDDSQLAAFKISTKKKGGIMALFSSHPPLDDRIKALEELRV